MTAVSSFANKSAVSAGPDRMAFLLDATLAGMDQVRLKKSLPRWLTPIAVVLAVSWELREGVIWVPQFFTWASLWVCMCVFTNWQLISISNCSKRHKWKLQHLQLSLRSLKTFLQYSFGQTVHWGQPRFKGKGTQLYLSEVAKNL